MMELHLKFFSNNFPSHMSSNPLEALDQKVIHLDKTVDEYFANYSKEKFQKAINASKTHGRSIPNRDDMYDQIETCNKLWVIKGLLDEISHSQDLETKINNLLKLKTKQTDLVDFLGQRLNEDELNSIQILKDIKVEITNHNDLLLTDIKHEFKKYLSFGSDLSVAFNKSVDELPFGNFIKCCDKISNDNHLFDLRKILIEWFTESLAKLHRGYVVELEKAKSTSIKINYINQEFQIDQYFLSIEKYIDFFNFVIQKDEYFIKPSVSKLLLADIKDIIFSSANITVLLKSKLDKHENGDQSIESMMKINDLLNQWPASDSSNDLEFWVDDLSTFWVESLVSKSIEDIKDFVKKLKAAKFQKEFSCLTTVELGSKAPKSTPAVKKVQSKDEEWDNGWDENWGEEEEVEEKTAPPSSEKSGTQNDEIDDEWDAWGEDEDLEIDIPESPQKKRKNSVPVSVTHSNHTIASNSLYQYSNLTILILETIDRYYSNLNLLTDVTKNKEDFDDLSKLFKSNIKKIMVSLLMMVGDGKDYPNVVLFYNDYTKILNDLSLKYDIDLTLNFKMSSRFISNYFNNFITSLESLVKEYNSTIWYDNNNDKEVRKSAMEFNIRVGNEIVMTLSEFEALKPFNTQLIIRNEITLAFQLFNLICDKLLSRNDISSDQCGIFAEIIDEIIIQFKGINLSQIQSFNKLSQIKIILSCNLKEILERFYDGQFYELETFELIELLKSLFVDSPNREDVVQQIKSVREVQLE